MDNAPSLLNHTDMMLSNVIIWVMLAVGVGTYYLLIDLCVLSKVDKAWFYRCQTWFKPIKGLLSSLPLLGLLGTISGLLQTFFSMSVRQGIDQQELISGGIAQALFTTQLGLILVVPGLLLSGLLQFKHNNWRTRYL